MTQRLQRLAVVGVGLIGGSFSLALKEAGLVDEVVGIGRSQANLDDALSHGVIDRVATRLEEGVAGADLVLVATPVGQMEALFARLAACLDPTTVLTDGGSTKCNVCDFARRHLGRALPRFIPAHPIAGAEFSGAAAAKADLYRHKQVVLTPLAETDAAAVERVSSLWQACGAHVSVMAPSLHDRIFAAVSHLPHLLSFALVEELARRPDGDTFFQFAASGFRDFTRIASSHPEMWRDISLANRDALLAELIAYQDQLARLKTLLEQGDGSALESVFATARAARNDWLAKKKAAQHG